MTTIILLVVFIVYVVMKVRESCVEGYRFKDLDFTDSGNLVNATGGIFGIGILIYVYVSSPEVTPLKRSTIIALAYLVLFLTLCLNILLRLKIPKGITSHHLNMYYLFK